MDYKTLTHDLVEKALKAGADAAEVYLETARRLSIQVQDGDLETIEEASTAGIGFRVLAGGRLGFSHCNDLSGKAPEETLRQAVAYARLTTPDENNVLPEAFEPAEVGGLFDPAIAFVSMEEKIRLALAAEKEALAREGITKSAGAGYGEGEEELYIANSNGLQVQMKSAGCSLGVSVVAEKDDQKNSGAEYASRRFFADLPAPELLARQAALKALRLLDPVMIPTQRASVIFDAEEAFSLLGGLLAALNGERVLQGASYLKNALGSSIAAPLLTLVDDGRKPRGMGSTPFDGEGVATQKRTLVEKGVLRGFLYNTITARRAGVESTGNAARGGFTELPGIGTHNLYAEPGIHTPAGILQATRRGLLVLEVTGYGINPVTGNFSGGASGLWIENGEIVHPVRGVTIAGNAADILNAIDMMGNDLDPFRTMAAPTFRVAEMQIGGK